MPSLKDVKMKIVGVGKTKQITKAMGMVASAKLRGAQSRIERFRPYASKYREVIGALAAKADGVSHPLLTEHEEKKHCCIILVTSDRGLCGGFNAAIIAEGLRLAGEARQQGMDVSFLCVGRKGREAIRKSSYTLGTSYADSMGSVDFALASAVASEVIHKYEDMELDEVWLVYGEFVSMAKQPPASLRLLPLKAPAAETDPDSGPMCEYVYEPSEAKLLEDLLPRYVKVQVYSGLLDTAASEHAARMAAMDNATRNCDELINSLTLLYNKTRQASITSELIDIVGGAEALKG